MINSAFKKLFLFRTFSYSLVITGFLATIFQFGPVLGAEFSYRYDKLTGISHKVEDSGTARMTDDGNSQGSFSDLKSPSEKIIKPVSTDYGLVIEKINANAKVVADVDILDERSYSKALQGGVAEARGSTKPGENGNTFIFSHSADAPWNITRFNAVFYLLRELEKGDRILVFYQGKRFDYTVFDKTVASPNDLSFLTNRYDTPVLTLQTCDPPGTLLNRLIVRARLSGS